MRVAIEAASLSLSSGGLARYTSELSLALARCFPEDEYFLVSDQPFRMPEAAPANLKRGGGPRNAMERRWWLWGIAREMSRLGADLVHGPDFAVPYDALCHLKIIGGEIDVVGDERLPRPAGDCTAPRIEAGRAGIRHPQRIVEPGFQCLVFSSSHGG